MARRRAVRRRRRRRRSGPLLALSLLSLFLVAMALTVVIGWDKGVGEWLEAFRAPVVKEVSLTGMHSRNGILIQARGGKMLGGEGEDERIYPASLTKMMTALVALEETKDLDASLTFTDEMFRGLYEEDASQAGFQPGETATFRDVIYGILLPSGAECCQAVAQQISGGTESFVALMNKKAQRLGMTNTHFENITGLHSPEHYSTCRDMAVLLKAGLRNPQFREMISSSYHGVEATDQHPEGFGFWHLMFRNLPDPYVTGGRILGGKTGYTQEAGYCLASYARIEGREYILVTTGAPANEEGSLHVEDARMIYTRLGEAAMALKQQGYGKRKEM